jgi:formylglycine-generating enzyme required for sulfatase activity
MFRQVSKTTGLVLTVFGSLAMPGCSNQPEVPKQNATAKETDTGAKTTAAEPKEAGGKKQITNSLGMMFIYCPSGSFTMGSPAAERWANEAQVPVTISKGFYLGKYSVTQAEFKVVMGATPWSGKDHVKEGDDYPATWVDWNDATEFCRKLTAQESKAGSLPHGYVYALPTDAEREYACRAGTTTAYSFGNERSDLGDYAWWGGMDGDGNCTTEQYSHRVGQKKPNPWGFFDMHGNVWEWCRDYYAAKVPGGADPFVASRQKDPLGAFRVNRGGSWNGPAFNCRSTCRYCLDPGISGYYLGFRVCLVLADKLSK